MYVMNGLGETDELVVRDAIRRARGSAYGGWQPYETQELQRILNTKLAARGLRIEESGQYNAGLCAAVEAIFGPGIIATSLKKEIGAACQLSVNPSQYLISTTGQKYMPTSYTSPAEGGGLIIDDEASPIPVLAPTEPQRPAKLLGDYCDVPSGLCAENSQLAAAIRGVATTACDNLLRYEGPLPPRVKGYSTNGLGGITCPPPGTNQITYQNLHFFLTNYSPCQLKNIGVCPPTPSPPFRPCPVGGACIDSRAPDILDTAVTQCQFKVTPRGDTSQCPAPNGVVTVASAHRFDPCVLAKTPMCGELDMNIPIPFSSQSVPGEEEDDDNTKYIVGGILGLLAVGGIVYAATRKKKKGKRK